MKLREFVFDDSEGFASKSRDESGLKATRQEGADASARAWLWDDENRVRCWLTMLRGGDRPVAPGFNRDVDEVRLENSRLCLPCAAADDGVLMELETPLSDARLAELSPQ